MYIVTNKSPKMFFISISIPGRSGVNEFLDIHNEDKYYYTLLNTKIWENVNSSVFSQYVVTHQNNHCTSE